MSMLTGLSDLMRRLASRRIVAITGGVFLVFAVAFFATSLPFSIAHVTSLCGVAPPDVRFYTSGVEVTQFLTACGAAGREAYRNLQVADLFYPAVSGLFLASALALILTRLFPANSPMISLAAVPLVGGAFDYLENAAAWTAVLAFPDPAETTTGLLGVASVAKQTASWASWLLLLLAIGYLIVRALQRRHPARPTAVSTGHDTNPAAAGTPRQRIDARRLSPMSVVPVISRGHASGVPAINSLRHRNETRRGVSEPVAIWRPN